MDFYKVSKNNGNENHFLVYMETRRHKEHYVCDYIAEDSPEADEANELGLTLRSRLLRSNGAFAMVEGTIFNPKRLLQIIVDLEDYSHEQYSGGIYRDSHSSLTVKADGCMNKYLLYDEITIKEIMEGLEKIKKRKTRHE